MTVSQVLVVWAMIALSAAAVAGVLASLKHRDISFWIAWSLLVPPMAVFLAFLPKYTGSPPRRRAPAHHDDHFF